MQSNTMVNDMNDPLTKKIFHHRITAVEEIDEDKDEDDSDFNGSFGDDSNHIIINFETIFD